MALLGAACKRETSAETRAVNGAVNAAMTSDAAPRPASAFLKGQTHLHSNASGDSETPAEDVVRWYAERGYDFIVFTDHNRITRPPSPATRGMLVIPGVELTQNLPSCAPPEPGYTCNLHVNAIFVSPEAPAFVTIPPSPTGQRIDCYQRAIELTASLGGLAQLDHPNFRYSASAALVTELARRGIRLLEIANESNDSNNAGDERHPSTEALWDVALTAGERVFGVASDDAHHYDDAAAVRARGDLAFVGDRGWIMVRAGRSVPEIRAAVERGDFHASNGVSLARVDVTPAAIEVDVAGGAAAQAHVFRFIGPGGMVLATTTGTTARFALAGHHGYVRATVTDAAGRKAWVQPAWLP